MKRPLLNEQDRQLLRHPDLKYRWDMFLATHKLKRELYRVVEPLLDAMERFLNKL